MQLNFVLTLSKRDEAEEEIRLFFFEHIFLPKNTMKMQNVQLFLCTPAVSTCT